MSKISTINYNKTHNYLSTCDLINKYNLLNVNKVPKLNKIVLKLSSRDLLSAVESLGKSEINSEIQVKSYFLLYIFSSYQPYIKFRVSKKLKGENDNYSLEIDIFSKEDIYSFLISFFIENWNKLSLEDFSLWKRKGFNFIFQQKKFIIEKKIPADVFFELENLLNKTPFGIVSKNLNLKVKFLFQNNNFRSQSASENLVKNLPFFWING